jgi:hypothetical protein
MRANTRLQCFQHFGYKAESVPPSMIAFHALVLARPWAFKIRALVCRVIVKPDSCLSRGTDKSRTFCTRIRENCRVGNACNTFEPLEDIHSQRKAGRLPTRPFLIAAPTDRITNEDTLLKDIDVFLEGYEQARVCYGGTTSLQY